MDEVMVGGGGSGAFSWCKPELDEPLLVAILPYSLSVSLRLIMPGHSARTVSLKDVTSTLTQHSISWGTKHRHPGHMTDPQLKGDG